MTCWSVMTRQRGSTSMWQLSTGLPMALQTTSVYSPTSSACEASEEKGVEWERVCVHAV